MMGKMSSARRFAARYLRFVLQRPGIILAAAAGVTLLFALQIPKLSFSTSVYDLIIEDLPENARYQDFKKRFGSDEIIRVVVKARDVFAPDTFKDLTALSDALARVDGIRRVVSLPEVRRAVDMGGNWPMEKFAAVLQPVTLFEGNLFSADHRTAALTLVLANDADQKAVIDAVQRILDAAPPPSDRYQIGMPLVSLALETFTRKDFFRLPPVTYGLIVLILWGIFRRFNDMVLPMICVTTSLVWTFGFMALTGIPLSILTMIVPVFLIAVGTAYCLHIVAEYHIWTRQVATPGEVVQETFRHISFPTALAVATTVIGLASLFISRIPMIREFALFACFGMFGLLVIVLSVFPALLTIMPLPAGEAAAPGRAGGRMDRLLETVVRWTLNRQRQTLIIFTLVAVFCLAGVFRLRVETNPLSYFKPDTPVSRHFHDIYHNLCGAFPVNLVMNGGQADFFEDPAQIQIMARVQRYLETLPGVDKTISLADYLKLVNYATNGFDPAYYALPQEGWALRMLYNNFKTLLGDDILQRFVTADLSAANITMMTHISSSHDVMVLRQQIRRHLAGSFPPDLGWDVTGFSVVVSASSDLLTKGQLKSLVLTMAVVFAIMFALFLSGKVGLIAIVPNLFPILVNFGVMGWLGIELSMFTSLIASIAIGLAVDDTIHYMVRYNREFKRDLDDVRALKETLHHIGRPILFTTVTISAGFSILALSSFQPTAIFGLMMVVTMVSALAGDLLLLPVLMRKAELVTLWDLVRIKLGVEPREGLPLFYGLSHTEVHYIIVAGALRQVDAGEVVFKKGEPSDSMYAVIAGELEVLDHPADVDPTQDGWDVKRLNMLHTGEVVGEMGLLRGAPRSATVVASQPTELLQINMNMIRRLQWLYPPTSHRFFLNLMNLLCDRIENVSSCLFASSQVDDLSGLCNRRAFLHLLEMELQRSRRYGDDLTLCLLNLEDDGQPPAASLPIPQRQQRIDFLHRLPRLLRGSDTIGRLDAKTLGLVMPHTAPSAARILSGRIQRFFDDNRQKVSIHLLNPAELPQDSGDALLTRAQSHTGTDLIPSFTEKDALPQEPTAKNR